MSKEEEPIKQIDLSDLTLHDLLALQNALPEIIEEAKKGEKAILRQRMEAMAAESGFELEELFADEDFESDSKKSKKRKQIGFVKAKYQNPEDPDQTWSGRGRKPKWAAKHIKDGGELKDLLIHPEIS